MIDLQAEFAHYLSCCSKKKQLSTHTIKAYRIDLTQFLKYKENMSSSKDDLTSYIEHLHTSYKPKTVRRKIASLKAFVHYLYYEDIIEINPFDKIDTGFKRPLMLPRKIPEHLIQKILSFAYRNISTASSDYELAVAVRNAVIIELLFATGARVFEICSLKTIDVDLVSKTVRILGKGSKERIIQIQNPDVIAILLRYKTLYQSHLQTDGFSF